MGMTEDILVQPLGPPNVGRRCVALTPDYATSGNIRKVRAPSKGFAYSSFEQSKGIRYYCKVYPVYQKGSNSIRMVLPIGGLIADVQLARVGGIFSVPTGILKPVRVWALFTRNSSLKEHACPLHVYRTSDVLECRVGPSPRGRADECKLASM